MADMRRWVTEWSGPGHSPKVTVMHARADQPIDDQLAALQALWFGCRGSQASLYGWLIPYEVEIIDEATGTLIGTETAVGDNSGVGASNVGPAADLTQVLLRWNTGVIVSGRRLQGRTYWPGIIATASDGGNLAAPVRAVMQGAVSGFVAAAQGFGVWHRPKSGADGQLAVLTGGSVWSEFASQRRRRG